MRYISKILSIAMLPLIFALWACNPIASNSSNTAAGVLEEAGGEGDVISFRDYLGSSLPVPESSGHLLSVKLGNRVSATYETSLTGDEVIEFYKANLPPMNFNFEAEDPAGTYTFASDDGISVLLILEPGENGVQFQVIAGPGN